LTGGIDVGPDKNLYVANVKVNHQFQDEGSTIMRFDTRTGKFLGVFVPQGKGLEVPFAMCFAERQTAVPKTSR
jgi:DNA-binding beta-propeller fold protein YncE